MSVPFRLPRFYPILETAALQARNIPVETAADALFEAGARVLQYRHKGDWTETHFLEAQNLAERAQKAGVLFVLNDRADFARLLRSALHIGQEDIPPRAARGIIGEEVIGFSTHNLSQVKRASEEPVEYLSIGPIFETGSKQNPDPVVGLAGLRKLRELTPKALVAIGGITLENAGEILATKVDSLAIISGLFPDRPDRKSIRKRAEEWLSTLDQ